MFCEQHNTQKTAKCGNGSARQEGQRHRSALPTECQQPPGLAEDQVPDFADVQSVILYKTLLIHKAKDHAGHKSRRVITTLVMIHKDKVSTSAKARRSLSEPERTPAAAPKRQHKTAGLPQCLSTAK